MPTGVVRLRNAIIFSLLVMLMGTFGYMLIEGWSFNDALYMTVITITTVGFGEVRELSDGGHLLTIVLIFLGVGSIGLTGTALTARLISGELRQQMRGQRMERRISRLRNHTILCGFGKIGRAIAREFHERDEALCVIETSERKVEEALDSGLLALVGDATDPDLLARCGIKHARGLLTALPKDSDNLFVVLTARDLAPEIQIVARGLDPGVEGRLTRAGADHVVSPYSIGGRRMATLLLHPEVVDFVDIFTESGGDDYSISQFVVREGSSLAGQRLQESQFRQRSGGAMILGIRRGSAKMEIPTAETVIQPGDKLVLLSTEDMLAQMKLAGY